MIYLKKFETQAAYNAAQSGLILPNVSLTVDNNTVHYNPSSPTPSHDYVEIGGIKWATKNVGANSVTDGGLYFAWGDTQGYASDEIGYGEGQHVFKDNNYKFNPSGDYETITKYNDTDRKTVLDLEDDSVNAAWGGNWRMPTTDEYASLGDAVNSAWTSDYQGSGVAGVILTDKTDSSKVLFFPAMGYAGEDITSSGYECDYWSSSLSVSSIYQARQMNARSSSLIFNSTTNRGSGHPVRGILDE